MRRPVPAGGILVALPLAAIVACARGSPSAPAPAISTFSATPRTIVAGGTARLRVAFTNGEGAIDHGIGPVASGEEVPVSPATTTTYTLSVVARSGAVVSRAATVQVEPATCAWTVARTESLEAAPAGATATQGAWGAQGPVDAGGRRGWGQGAAWSRLAFPADLGPADVVGLEVDLWVPPHAQPVGAAVEDAWTLAIEVLGMGATVAVPIRPGPPTFRWTAGRAIPIPDPAGAWHTLRITGRRSACALQAQLDGLAVDAIAGSCPDRGELALSSTSSNASFSAPGVAWSRLRLLRGNGGVCLAPSGPPKILEAASAVDQASGASRAVDDPPAVAVRDASGWPIAGAAVEFRVTAGGGAVSGSPATTDAHGVARVGAWIVGPGGAQGLEARLVNAPELTVAFTAAAREAAVAYDLGLELAAGVPDAVARAAVRARARVERIVVGDLPDATVPAGLPGGCGTLSPGPVDDLRAGVVVEAIDGPGGLLAQAGPCLLRDASHLPVLGLVRVDSADVAMLEANGALDAVVLHELLHVVGFGTVWSSFGLVSGAGGADPLFTGPEAIAAFLGHDGGAGYAGAPVPLENGGGAATANVHWRASVFGRELMTGFAGGSANPVGRTTIGSLADVGYGVDLAAADPFQIIGAALRAAEAPGIPIAEALVTPAYTVDAGGTLAPLAR